MDGNISFNSNNLKTFDGTAGIIVDDIDLDNLPNKQMGIFGLAHSNNSEIPNTNNPYKVLPITGTVVGTSPTDLSARLDTFRSYLIGKKKNLDINYNGGTRRYIATVSPNSNIKRSVNKKFARFAIEFICTPPYGQDTANTTALNATGRTLATYTDNYTFLGTAPSQLPVATITLTAVSSTGMQSMFWGNNGNGQGITISRNNWTAGDVVVIDASDPKNQKVTINGGLVDFVGAFPEFAPGAQAMSYSDTFASRTVSENVVYKKRYM